MTSDTNPDITAIQLFHVATGEMHDAELWDAITDKNLADWEAEWTLELFQLLTALNRQGIERKFWPQSRGWNWRAKLSAIEGCLGNQTFSIVCGDMTQAMMTTDLTKHAKIENQKNDHLVYVDFLEAAPWNRRELVGQPPVYAGAGSILILAAIQLSKMEGFKGRIGLHSLPQANDFYSNKCGMTDIGQDQNYENLRYFEMTPEQAEAFIEKGKK